MSRLLLCGDRRTLSYKSIRSSPGSPSKVGRGVGDVSRSGTASELVIVIVVVTSVDWSLVFMFSGVDESIEGD
jgi:hypothetical protein